MPHDVKHDLAAWLQTKYSLVERLADAEIKGEGRLAPATIMCRCVEALNELIAHYSSPTERPAMR
jgi:hypothetical protein